MGAANAIGFEAIDQRENRKFFSNKDETAYIPYRQRAAMQEFFCLDAECLATMSDKRQIESCK
jgi:hypothetical protein